MTLGLAPRQLDLLRRTSDFCDSRVGSDSIYSVLHRECFNLFPDEMFADLFTDVGRRSVPPMIVAVVMVLQRVEGLSDREAVDRFTFDARWKYAAGGLAFDHPGFVHTVLVEMRARLARSDRPDRIFQATLEVARSAGLVGRRRVLDSTPLYDAVATMDTVTLLRSGIRGLLRAAGPGGDLHTQLCAVLTRDDDYVGAGKPVCDWDDTAARAVLVDALARDANAALAVLDDRELPDPIEQAGQLLATLVGQDLDCSGGVFRIARRVAKDRVISTVDPEARHGRKTAAHAFDGYKGHVAIDPDSEVITATTVTPGNTGDAASAGVLLAEELAAARRHAGTPPGQPAQAPETGQTPEVADAPEVAQAPETGDAPETGNAPEVAGAPEAGDAPEWVGLAVFGDAAYGAGELLEELADAGAEAMVKVAPPASRGGRFAKDQFDVDNENATVTCPAGNTAPLRPAKDGGGAARFGKVCSSCPLAGQCTTARNGRTIRTTKHEDRLVAARAEQKDPTWREAYRANRPKVERKLGHMMRRKHGGRRARVRGTTKIEADFSLLAAATNLARFAVLGVRSTHQHGWIHVTA